MALKMNQSCQSKKGQVRLGRRRNIYKHAEVVEYGIIKRRRDNDKRWFGKDYCPL